MSSGLSWETSAACLPGFIGSDGGPSRGAGGHPHPGGKPPLGSQEVSATPADSSAAEGPILDPSGHSAFLQGGSGASAWTETNTVAGATTPTARVYHAMTKTPSGVLLFGGNGTSVLGDTWLFNTATGTWGLLTNTVTAPSARTYHAMAATPSGDVLLFGGSPDEGITCYNDTWLYRQATQPPPAPMPGMSPWALGLLSIALLGAGGWWFSRRRRLA